MNILIYNRIIIGLLRIWLSVRKLKIFLIGVIIIAVAFITAPFLFNEIAESVNFRVISIPIFFLSSSIGLYVFLFREKKEVSRSNIYKSMSQKVFEFNLIVNLMVLWFLFFVQKFSVLAIIIVGISYLIFLYVTLYSTNTYKSSILSFKFLNFLLKCLTLDLEIRDKKNNLKNNQLIISYINETLFTTISSLNYLNRQLELQKAKILNDLLSETHENIKSILLGDEDNNAIYLKRLEQTNKTSVDEIDETLIHIYHNYLKELKNLVLSKEVAQEISAKVFKLVYDLLPIIKYRGFQSSNINERYELLEYKYSITYISVLKEILTETSINFSTDNEVIYRQYIIDILTTIKTREHYNLNEYEKVRKFARYIECSALLEFVLSNNLKGVINFNLCIITKKNMKDTKEENDVYLRNLILITIKSVELTNYEITGYLTKMISSNYSPREINNEFINIKKDFQKYERSAKRDLIVERIGEDRILLHGLSFDYCLCKCYYIHKIFNYDSSAFTLKFDDDKLESRVKEKIRFDSERLSIDEHLIDKLCEV